jgi:hypothetical protein
MRFSQGDRPAARLGPMAAPRIAGGFPGPDRPPRGPRGLQVISPRPSLRTPWPYPRPPAGGP